jgi:hypothetical protein
MTVSYSGTLAGTDGSSLAVTGAVLTPAGFEPPPADPPPSGRVLTGASGTGVANGWLASQVASLSMDVASTWTDSPSTALAQATLSGEYGKWSGWIDLAIGGMWPKRAGHSWAKAANRELDPLWKTILESIKRAYGTRDLDKLAIRFAHECNGDWYEWSVTKADVSNYKEAFGRFRDMSHSILPGARVLWPMNDDTLQGFNFTEAYPGADALSVDSYNHWPHVKTPAEFAAKMLTTKSGTPRGLEAWRLFAESRGIPMVLSEWGNSSTVGSGGGGESPAYVQEMRKWLDAHGGTGPGQIIYASYYNLQNYTLTSGQPKTWEAYRAAF